MSVQPISEPATAQTLASGARLPDHQDRRTGTVGVAIVGCGYWGPNLIRNFSLCPATRVEMVCDQDPSRLEKARALCPQAEAVPDVREVLADPRVEAVAIATPVQTHERLVSAALEAGKHVL